MTRPEIDWYAALETAEHVADHTDAHWMHGGLHNLAHAYLELLSDAARLRMALDEARGVAVEDEA